MNCGSLDNLNPSTRWGLSSKAFQIRPIVDLLSPERSAIFARDQCVAFAGVDSNVATTTSSTRSAPITGGRPGRGSSTNPSRRSSTNRARHLPTVAAAHPSSTATVLLSMPPAHASTIFDRNANACADFARRDHRDSWARSSSVNTSSAFGRPDLAIPQPTTYPANFRRRTLVPLGISHRSELVGQVRPRLGGGKLPDGVTRGAGAPRVQQLLEARRRDRRQLSHRASPIGDRDSLPGGGVGDDGRGVLLQRTNPYPCHVLHCSTSGLKVASSCNKVQADRGLMRPGHC